MTAASSKKLLKNLPTEQEMNEIVAGLVKQDHRAMVLMGGAYIEYSLERLLRASFRELSKDDDNRMFDGAAGGILGSFNAKIRVAYATGLIAEEACSRLTLICDIRNVFAHSLHKVDFDNPLVVADCNRLRTFLKEALPHLDTSTGGAAEVFCATVRILFIRFAAPLRRRGVQPEKNIASDLLVAIQARGAIRSSPTPSQRGARVEEHRVKRLDLGVGGVNARKPELLVRQSRLFPARLMAAGHCAVRAARRRPTPN
jgi:hypothetical protein